jgi:hypothetical protein
MGNSGSWFRGLSAGIEGRGAGLEIQKALGDDGPRKTAIAEPLWSLPLAIMSPNIRAPDLFFGRWKVRKATSSM